MQGSVQPATATARHQASALLAWWQLAGADHAVSDGPTTWLAAAAPAPGTAAAMPAPKPALSATIPVAAAAPAPNAEAWSACHSWEALVAHLRTEWPLCPVLDGNPASGLLVIGEAPSAEDLRTGRPFTGPAGALLDRMLAAIGRDRTSAAIMLLACRRRVPGKPPPEAVAQDLPLARRLIRLIAPRHMLLLGQIPTDAIGGASGREAIGAMRGRWLDVDGTPALPTFNPAYLLRNPAAKADAWADLLALKARLGQ